MKKSMMARICGLALVTCMATTALFGGTLAKYTSTQSNNATAQIAKWSFNVNNTDIATTTFDFNLFDTDFTNVDDDKVAPGTSGSFAFALENTSEVAADYSIAFTTANTANVPIQYSLLGTDSASDWTASIGDLNKTATLKSLKNVGEDDANKATVTIYWKWVTKDNISDTTIGIDAAGTFTNPTVTATVTATQTDPVAPTTAPAEE